MRSREAWAVLLAALMCATPSVAYADFVWPALYAEQRLLSVPVIVAGLLVEIVVLRFCFAMSSGMAVRAGLLANIVSGALGVMLIPIAGIGWEFFPGLILYHAFNMGTFNPLTWVVTFLLATLITTVIELLVLRWAFGLRGGRRGFFIWTAANAVSVALAFLSLALPPLREAPLFDLWPFG